jgi:hypothetical protein
MTAVSLAWPVFIVLVSSLGSTVFDSLDAVLLQVRAFDSDERRTFVRRRGLRSTLHGRPKRQPPSRRSGRHLAGVKLPDVEHARCIGQASGTALMVLAHGARGHRSASARARLQLVPIARTPERGEGAGMSAIRLAHAPEGGDGRAGERDAAHNLGAEIVRRISADTGKDVVSIAEDMDRSRTFDATQPSPTGSLIVSRGRSLSSLSPSDRSASRAPRRHADTA